METDQEDVSAEEAGSESRPAAAEQPQYERRWSKKSSSSRPADVTPEQESSEDADESEKQRARADDLFDRLQRALADLANYRKRVESEREDMAKFASMLLVSELLPVLDNFDRALETLPKELEYFTWIQGVMLVERQLRAILERQGVEPIKAVGEKFNPSLHEAIVEEESSEAAPGTVIGELQTGYTMYGRVLRPTLAKVAKALSAEPSQSTPAEPEPGQAEDVEQSPTDAEVTAEAGES
ncbi:MAG TPA: nucleotide exchange factor GrpE [Chloroflexota bacterium]|nr:nucleotide exchange factor GrpE [Chloroflexota bacterium]